MPSADMIKSYIDVDYDTQGDSPNRKPPKWRVLRDRLPRGVQSGRALPGRQVNDLGCRDNAECRPMTTPAVRHVARERQQSLRQRRFWSAYPSSGAKKLPVGNWEAHRDARTAAIGALPPGCSECLDKRCLRTRVYHE